MNAQHTPFFTVLINNYNYAHYLPAAVDSVLNQTLQDFEIIIVDDGSTDHSRDILRHYTDNRISTIFQANQGQAAAFNAAFAQAKGKLIAFLDSDDWWKPEKLETVLRWHEFMNGRYAMMQHLVDVWEDGRQYPYKPALYSGDCFLHTQTTGELGLFVGSSGLVFPKHILDQIFPIPTCFRISADAYMTRTSFTLGIVCSIPESLGYYRKHSNAVLGNARYNYASFIHEILLPNLNVFYKKRGIDFAFQEPQRNEQPISFAPPCLLHVLMKERLNRIFSQYPQVAVFGAGKHTAWLQELSREHGSRIVAVLDDRPPRNILYWGLAPVAASSWTPRNTQAILLSSDSVQEQMRTRCRQLFGPEMPLIDLYEGLPPGPYAK